MSKTKPDSPSAKTTAPDLPSFGFDTDTILRFGISQMRTLAQVNDSVLKGMVAVHEEMTRFIDHRLKEDRDFQRALSSCETPTDAFQTYSVFLQDSMNEYWAEMAKLGELAAENSLNSLAEINGGKEGDAAK